MRSHSLLLTLGLALATTYGLAQTGSQAGQGQYPSSQSPTTQQEPSPQQMPPSNAPSQGQATPGQNSPDQGQATTPGQSQTTNSSSANTPDNDTLAQQVQQKLSAEPSLKGVQVEAKKGVVTLTGEVTSKADRKHAEELAKSVPGVKKVHAKLKVNANGAGATSGATGTTSGAAATPAPSTAGSEASNTSAQAGVEQGNREPGSMTSSTQPENQQGAENPSAQAGASAQAQQSPGTTENEPGQTQPGMTQQGVQTPSQQGAEQNQQTGSAQANNQMGTAQTGNASQLQSQIQNALAQQGTLSGSNIQANVTDTQIVLTGTVQTPDQKQTAERIAGSYAGNRQVVNHITVSSLSGQTGGENPQAMPPTGQPQGMPGQGGVNPQTPPRQTPPSQQQQQPPMSENPPVPHF